MKKPWIVGLSFGAVGLALLLWGLEVALNREESDVGKPGAEAVAGTRTVELTFPDADGRFEVETREILGGEELQQDVRRTVEELIAGPQEGVHPLPPATRLLDVFFDGDGELTLNFSDDLRTDHPGGSEAELATLRCLVATIATNFPIVDRVRILVDGDAVPTIAGHVDLNEPLEVGDFR